MDDRLRRALARLDPWTRKSLALVERAATDANSTGQGLLWLHIRMLVESLVESEELKTLASEPAKFELFVDRRLQSVKSELKRLYGIDAHRPRRSEQRDRLIYEMRQSGQTFSQIAETLGMKKTRGISPASAVQRAYARYVARLEAAEEEKNRLVEVVERVAAVGRPVGDDEMLELAERYLFHESSAP